MRDFRFRKVSSFRLGLTVGFSITTSVGFSFAIDTVPQGMRAEEKTAIVPSPSRSRLAVPVVVPDPLHAEVERVLVPALGHDVEQVTGADEHVEVRAYDEYVWKTRPESSLQNTLIPGPSVIGNAVVAIVLPDLTSTGIRRSPASISTSISWPVASRQ